MLRTRAESAEWVQSSAPRPGRWRQPRPRPGRERSISNLLSINLSINEQNAYTCGFSWIGAEQRAAPWPPAGARAHYTHLPFNQSIKIRIRMDSAGSVQSSEPRPDRRRRLQLAGRSASSLHFNQLIKIRIRAETEGPDLCRAARCALACAH